MKQICVIIIASALGAVFGSAVVLRYKQREVTAGERLDLSELVMRDDQRRVVARLGSSNGRTVLSFYSAGNPVLEIGIEDAGISRFIRFFGTNGQVVAAMNSLPPNGGATLYLGDEKWATRMIIGSLRTDIPSDGGKTPEDWGLELRNPGTHESLFTILGKSDSGAGRPNASVRLIRSNGKIWAVH